MEADRVRDEQSLHGHGNLKKRVIFDGVIVGFVAGLVSIAYRLTLGVIGEWSHWIYQYAVSNVWVMLLVFVGLAGLGLLIGLLVKFAPLSSGSGIPQIQAENLGEVEMRPWRLLFAKFLGGSIANLGGLSLGREGPSIQLGGATGKILSRFLGKSSEEEPFMISAGASAGLAAAFNAPISGTLFTLEEMHKRFIPLLLVPSLLASVMADFVSKNIFGLAPVFSFQISQAIPLELYGWIILLGIVCGVVGALFNFVLLRGQDLYAALPIPKVFWPVIAMVFAGVFALVFPQVLGGGHDLMEGIAEHRVAIGFLVLLLFLKVLFTSISYGSSAQGGIFLPVLVIGGVTGAVVLESLVALGLISPEYYVNFIILAMAAVLAGVVRAPILSVLLVTEMTASFQHILALTVAVAAAYLTAEFLGSKPIYESLLQRLLKQLKG